ncbi:uncharacterized protein LOC143593619 isoform X2 [Bidens hawaiensis]|uniref:uncharacterized protein LOC143593619 isoform X2 n=1 Tax=Bidens hawaiensis TaxID=980011 RepID=UPI00404A622C
MSSSTTQTTENRRQLYRVTTRILNDNSLHFILYSLLFLPATFSAYTAVKFYFSSTPGTNVNTMFDPFNLFLIKTILASLTVKTLIKILAFAFFVILPTVAGVALITYSANQAIHRKPNNKPITFSSTFKSLSHSCIPLLHTIISGSIILIILFLVFTLSPIVLIKAIKALGFHFDTLYLSIFVNTIVSYALAMAIIFCMVVWGSAAAITILEQKSGFETLRQSANQSTEYRRHSFSIVFITGFGLGTSLAYSTVTQKETWTLVLQVGAIYLQSLLMILMYVVANTVLYVQGKVEASGEEASKTVVDWLKEGLVICCICVL